MDHHCCYGCGDSLDSIFCQRCTCKSCGNSAYHGYNCPSKVLIISNPEPYHDQNVDEFPQTLPSFHLTCYSRDENSFAYDSTPDCVNDSSNIFNPPSQPLMYSYEFSGNDAQYGHDCPLQHEAFQCQQVIFYDPCYENCRVIDHLNLQQRINDSMIELYGTFQAWLQQQKDLVVNLDSYSPSFCNDSLIMGDEHLDTYLEKESDKLKSGIENLVPNPSEFEDERECDVLVCDDFTTFSNLLFDVDDDFSSSDNESFSDEDIPKEIYSNPLFDEEIISIKIDPHHFNAESGLIESLLNQDSSIISSSKIDSLLDEFAGELILLKSIPLGINEADCDPEEEIHLIKKLLYDNSSLRPPEEFDSENSDDVIESFSPSRILVEDSDPFLKEIDLFLTYDGSIPLGIDSDYSDSEGDNLFPERLLHDYPIPLPNILDFSNVVRIPPSLPIR
nr:hypothetical protein [Tanacetum cinerariifolium]